VIPLDTYMSEDPVAAILRSALQLEDDYALADATHLAEIPSMDSLGQVRLVMEIERILDDRLSMDEILGMESVGDIRSLLATRGKLSVER
jgi:acyl carrier protein